MAEVSSSITAAQVAAMIAQSAGAGYVSSPTSAMTVADLMANFPPGASYLNQYARVSDLYGSVDDIMRCRFDGVNYRWVPQRPFFSGTTAATSGTVVIIPLVTPPTLRLTANLLGNINVTPSSVNAFVGQQQRIIQDGTLGLFTTTITGLIGSNITLLGGNTKLLEYGPTGWFGYS